MSIKKELKSKKPSTKSSKTEPKYEGHLTAITQSSNLLLVDGKPRPITEEMIERGRDFGLSPEKVASLLKAGTDYEYTPDGLRIQPKPFSNGLQCVVKRENHHLIKPDPDGVFYLKVTIKGKCIVKPLHKEVKKARAMRDKLLKELGYSTATK